MDLDEMTKSPLFRAILALRLIKSFNYLRNDLDAYLFEVYLCGIGEREDWPDPKDYGINDNQTLEPTCEGR